MERTTVAKAILARIKRRVKPESLVWLLAQADVVVAGPGTGQLNRIFAQIPRYTSKGAAELSPAEDAMLWASSLNLDDWSLETLCRVWILMQLSANDKERYVDIIQPLFEAAEMNELVALYKALPFLHYPESWIGRCEEGIRSNIGLVLEAIMYHNSYPAEWLSEAAWNQMILKAFFTEKNVLKIERLEARMNVSLISKMEDYVRERQAAGRTVNPELDKLINITE